MSTRYCWYWKLGALHNSSIGILLFPFGYISGSQCSPQFFVPRFNQNFYRLSIRAIDKRLPRITLKTLYFAPLERQWSSISAAWFRTSSWSSLNYLYDSFKQGKNLIQLRHGIWSLMKEASMLSLNWILEHVENSIIFHRRYKCNVS